MSLSVQLGLLLALLTALSSIVGFLYKHRGAVESPDVEWRRPVRSSLRLLRSRWYALGMAIAMGSWGLHVGALALAPISLVQATIAGGLVLLTVVADRAFGFEVTRREWLGVACTAAGLAFLAATLDGAGDSAHADFEAVRLATYVALGTGLGVLLVLGGREGPRAGVLLHPLAAVILFLSLLGLLVSARSLQLGDAVPVIAITSATANVWTIAAGPIVFAEPLPDDALGLTLRLAAFVLVVSAAALTPPPVRAAGVEPASP